MAEITFPCPSCYKHIQCDEAWCGDNIKCPMCHAELRVPSKDKLTDNPLVPKPPSGGGAAKLSAGATSVARPSFGKNVPVRNLTTAQAKKSNPLVTYGGLVVALAAIGAGVYFGLPYYQKWRSGETDQAAATPGKGKGPEGATNAEPAQPPPPPPPATNQPAVWTLDVAKAQIPGGKINGKIAGTNFLADTVRLDRVGYATILNMRQGAGVTPDRGMLVYLRLPAGEAPAGKKFEVSPTDKPTTVTQVTKLWKPNPRYAAQQKNFSTGYALKLEFGAQAEDGSTPGKIFLALPDPEQSVLGGTFTVSAAAAQPTEVVPQATPVTPQDPAAQDRFNKRYGIRR